MSPASDALSATPAWALEGSAAALPQVALGLAGMVDPSMAVVVLATLFVTAMLKGMVGLGLSRWLWEMRARHPNVDAKTARGMVISEAKTTGGDWCIVVFYVGPGRNTSQGLFAFRAEDFDSAQRAGLEMVLPFGAARGTGEFCEAHGLFSPEALAPPAQGMAMYEVSSPRALATVAGAPYGFIGRKQLPEHIAEVERRTGRKVHYVGWRIALARDGNYYPVIHFATREHTVILTISFETRGAEGETRRMGH